MHMQMDIFTNLPMHGVVSIAAGVLILVMPRLLNYIVAIYLIVTGIMMIAR